MPITPQAAKSKGRRLQKWVRDRLLVQFPELEEDDVRSTSMGAGGEDVLLSPKARSYFPYSIECKNTERPQLWASYEQAKANCGGHQPLVVMKKNGEQPLAIVDFDYFLKLHKDVE